MKAKISPDLCKFHKLFTSPDLDKIIDDTKSEEPSEAGKEAVVILSIFGAAIVVILLIYIVFVLLKCYRNY